MLGAESLTKPGQVLLTADAESCERVRELFPDFPVCTPAFIDALEGRDVILMQCAELGAQCATVAKSVSVIENAIPYPLAPAGAVKWAKQHKKPYNPESGHAANVGDCAETPQPSASRCSDPTESAAQDHETEPVPFPASSVSPVAVDTESAPPAADESPQAPIQATRQAAADPDETFIGLPDGQFCDAWRDMPWDQRDRLPVAIQSFAVDRYLALNTHVSSTIAKMRAQDAKEALNEPESHEQDGPLPDVPGYLLDVPTDAETGYNGYDPHESSRIYAKPLNGDQFAGVHPIDLLQVAVMQELNVSILPGWMQDRAGDIARRTGCDAGIAPLADFVAMGNLADCNYRAQPRTLDWKYTQATGFFGTVIGDTGTRKTAASDAALETPWKIDTQQQEFAAVAIKRHTMARRIYEAQVSDYVKQAKKSGVGLQEPIEPEPPNFNYFRVNDFTIEGLRKMLTHCHNGVMIVTDELQTLIGGLGRYSSGKGAAAADKGFILQGYDGGVKIFARQGDGANVKNWRFGILGLTTPQSFRDALVGKSTESDGYLQRQLVVCPVLCRIGENRAPDEKSLALYEKICNNLMDARIGTPTVLKFSPEAAEFFSDFELRIRDMITSSIYSPGMRGCLEKYTGTICRLALIYQLSEFALHDQHATERDTISLENVKMAADYLQYQIGQQEYLWSHIIGGSGAMLDPLTDAIAKWIIAHEKLRFKLRDLSIGISSAWTRHKDQHAVSALRLLEDSGWLVPKGGPSKNRPGLFTEYDVNPDVHPMYDDGRRDKIIVIRKAHHDEATAKRQAAQAARDQADQDRGELH